MDQFIQIYTAGTDLFERLAAAPFVNVSGTYSMHFEYCTPASGEIKGLFQAHHGLIGTGGYWNVHVDGSVFLFLTCCLNSRRGG